MGWAVTLFCVVSQPTESSPVIGCGQVNAEHEEKTETGATKRMYVRQYSLPQGIDVDHVIPSLTSDGVLTVEAPATSLSPTERLVPIEYKHHADEPAHWLNQLESPDVVAFWVLLLWFLMSLAVD